MRYESTIKIYHKTRVKKHKNTNSMVYFKVNIKIKVQLKIGDNRVHLKTR